MDHRIYIFFISLFLTLFYTVENNFMTLVRLSVRLFVSILSIRKSLQNKKERTPSIPSPSYRRHDRYHSLQIHVYFNYLLETQTGEFVFVIKAATAFKF